MITCSVENENRMQRECRLEFPYHDKLRELGDIEENHCQIILDQNVKEMNSFVRDK